MAGKKSRLTQPNRSVLYDYYNDSGFNAEAHEEDTVPRRKLWTSAATLAVGEYTPWHPIRAGVLISARAQVMTAGSSDTTFDINIGGISVLDSPLVVPSGSKRGRIAHCTKRPTFQQGTAWTIEIVSVGTGAEGPAVVEIEYEEGW